MKKLLLLCLSLFTIGTIFFLIPKKSQKQVNKIERKTFKTSQNEEKKEEKSPEERARFAEERLLYEYYRQVNPITGKISKEEKLLEFNRSKQAKLRNSSSSRTIETSYISRGPSNFGGRTRALVVDITDDTGKTMLAGGVSGGVFRTTNGGTSWTKVSSNDEIHNVTAIVQDPRPGEELTWYYGTGEGIGSSASLSGAFYAGQGIWKSIDGGLNWNLMPGTSTSEPLDSRFDIVFDLAVHPLKGDLYAAILGQIVRFNGTIWINEKAETDGVNNFAATDIEIGSDGRVYVAFSGVCNTVKGVWTSSTGIGSWSRISNGIFTPAGRVVLALSPSNQNKLYVLFDNGNESDCDNPVIEADLWMYDLTAPGTGFTNYSSKLPDDPGCTVGNDPFSIQGGYDLVVSVKPDDENFVVIGGTNAYKKTNITTVGTFDKIGGYAIYNPYKESSYAKYPNHHPDIHAMVFDPFNNSIMYSGTDGGVHKTTDVTASPVAWTSLNNNYQTFQYYHVGIDPLAGTDYVIGGAQDNGITVGGTAYGNPDLTTHSEYAGGDGCSVAISRDDACLPFFVSLQLGTLYRDCPVFDEITPEISLDTPYDSEFVTLFHLDQDNNNALYYAAQGTLLRTTDATAVTSSTWTDLSDLNTAFVHNDYFQTFSTSWGAYDALTSYLLMGGDEGHIYRLDDPHNAVDVSSAVDITPPTATLGFPSIVTGLAIHPSNNDIVLATYSNYGTESIFLTTNATATSPTWTLVERNLDTHSIRSAAIIEANGETTYIVGTARGLYSSSDPVNIDWVREAPNEIGFAVVSDLKYRPSDNKLLIGTHGNGMYEATISSTLGVDDFENISGLMKLYPNPVQNDLNVRLPQTNGAEISYLIYNLSGQIISMGKLGTESVNVSQLTSGMYILQLKTSDGRKGAKSFIKK
jgi:hypothetical protein